jgi:hypothetical protein
MGRVLIDGVNGSSLKHVSAVLCSSKTLHGPAYVDPRYLLSKPLNNHPCCATVWILVTAILLLCLISTDRSHTQTHTHTPTQRRYQRTTNNERLRQERKEKYFNGRHEYEGKMQAAKLKSWKTFCTINDGANPWNIVYKIAAGKIRTPTRLTTLEKKDGTYTTDTRSTILHMLDHFVLDDREDSDTELHRKIRKEIQEPPDTADDKAFTKEEILANLKKFNSKKAPGEDGLTSDILTRAFQVFPSFFTQMYNTCPKKGCFPKKWKHSIIIPITKPAKRNVMMYQSIDQ